MNPSEPDRMFTSNHAPHPDSCMPPTGPALRPCYPTTGLTTVSLSGGSAYLANCPQATLWQLSGFSALCHLLDRSHSFCLGLPLVSMLTCDRWVRRCLSLAPTHTQAEVLAVDDLESKDLGKNSVQ